MPGTLCGDSSSIRYTMWKPWVSSTGHLAGLDIEALIAELQDRLGRERTIRVIAVGQLHKRHVAGVHRVGVAQELLAVREHDIVVAPRVRRNRVRQRLADRVMLGIDDAQGGIAVLVLQRPDLAAERIELQAVDVTLDLITVL